MLDLPGDDSVPAPVPLDQPGGEFTCSVEKRSMRSRLDEDSLSQGGSQTVRRDEELRVAEGLERADAEDHLFPSLLRRVDLPVELGRVEHPWLALDSIPVGAQADDLEWTGQDLEQGRMRVQPQGVGLRRPEADTKSGRAPRFDGHLAPPVGR